MLPFILLPEVLKTEHFYLLRWFYFHWFHTDFLGGCNSFSLQIYHQNATVKTKQTNKQNLGKQKSCPKSKLPIRSCLTIYCFENNIMKFHLIFIIKFWDLTYIILRIPASVRKAVKNINSHGNHWCIFYY